MENINHFMTDEIQLDINNLSDEEMILYKKLRQILKDKDNETYHLIKHNKD